MNSFLNMILPFFLLSGVVFLLFSGIFFSEITFSREGRKPKMIFFFREKITLILFFSFILVILNQNFSSNFIFPIKFFQILIIFFSTFILFLSNFSWEKLLLLLVGVTGSFFILVVSKFYFFYLSFEIISFTTLSLSINPSGEKILGVEASLKYFFISFLGSILLLSSFLMYFCNFGIISFEEVELLIKTNSSSVKDSSLFFGATLLFFSAFLVKLALPPWHIWLSDILAAAEFGTIAFLTIPIELTNLAVLLKYFGLFKIMLGNTILLVLFFLLLSISSIVVGFLGSSFQAETKRLLSYSSIGNVGIFVVCYLMLNFEGYFSAYFYIFFYFLALLNFLNFFMILTRKNSDEVKDWRSLVRKTKNNYFLFFSFFSCILLIGGFPPFPSFLGKLKVLESLILCKFNILTFFVFSSFILSLFYSLRILFSNLKKEKINFVLFPNETKALFFSCFLGVSLFSTLILAFPFNLDTSFFNSSEIFLIFKKEFLMNLLEEKTKIISWFFPPEVFFAKFSPSITLAIYAKIFFFFNLSSFFNDSDLIFCFWIGLYFFSLFCFFFIYKLFTLYEKEKGKKEKKKNLFLNEQGKSGGTGVTYFIISLFLFSLIIYDVNLLVVCFVTYFSLIKSLFLIFFMQLQYLLYPFGLFFYYLLKIISWGSLALELIEEGEEKTSEMGKDNFTKPSEKAEEKKDFSKTLKKVNFYSFKNKNLDNFMNLKNKVVSEVRPFGDKEFSWQKDILPIEEKKLFVDKDLLLKKNQIFTFGTSVVPLFRRSLFKPIFFWNTLEKEKVEFEARLDKLQNFEEEEKEFVEFCGYSFSDYEKKIPANRRQFILKNIFKRNVLDGLAEEGLRQFGPDDKTNFAPWSLYSKNYNTTLADLWKKRDLFEIALNGIEIKKLEKKKKPLESWKIMNEPKTEQESIDPDHFISANPRKEKIYSDFSKRDCLEGNIYFNSLLDKSPENVWRFYLNKRHLENIDLISFSENIGINVNLDFDKFVSPVDYVSESLESELDFEDPRLYHFDFRKTSNFTSFFKSFLGKEMEAAENPVEGLSRKKNRREKQLIEKAMKKRCTEEEVGKSLGKTNFVDKICDENLNDLAKGDKNFSENFVSSFYSEDDVLETLKNKWCPNKLKTKQDRFLRSTYYKILGKNYSKFFKDFSIEKSQDLRRQNAQFKSAYNILIRNLKKKKKGVSTGLDLASKRNLKITFLRRFPKVDPKVVEELSSNEVELERYVIKVINEKISEREKERIYIGSLILEDEEFRRLFSKNFLLHLVESFDLNFLKYFYLRVSQVQKSEETGNFTYVDFKSKALEDSNLSRYQADVAKNLSLFFGSYAQAAKETDELKKKEYLELIAAFSREYEEIKTKRLLNNVLNEPDEAADLFSRILLGRRNIDFSKYFKDVVPQEVEKMPISAGKLKIKRETVSYSESKKAIKHPFAWKKAKKYTFGLNKLTQMLSGRKGRKVEKLKEWNLQIQQELLLESKKKFMNFSNLNKKVDLWGLQKFKLYEKKKISEGESVWEKPNSEKIEIANLIFSDNWKEILTKAEYCEKFYGVPSCPENLYSFFSFGKSNFTKDEEKILSARKEMATSFFSDLSKKIREHIDDFDYFEKIDEKMLTTGLSSLYGYKSLGEELTAYKRLHKRIYFWRNKEKVLKDYFYYLKNLDDFFGLLAEEKKAEILGLEQQFLTEVKRKELEYLKLPRMLDDCILNLVYSPEIGASEVIRYFYQDVCNFLTVGEVKDFQEYSGTGLDLKSFCVFLVQKFPRELDVSKLDFELVVRQNSRGDLDLAEFLSKQKDDEERHLEKKKKKKNLKKEKKDKYFFRKISKRHQEGGEYLLNKNIPYRYFLLNNLNCGKFYFRREKAKLVCFSEEEKKARLLNEVFPETLPDEPDFLEISPDLERRKSPPSSHPYVNIPEYLPELWENEYVPARIAEEAKKAKEARRAEVARISEADQENFLRSLNNLFVGTSSEEVYVRYFGPRPAEENLQLRARRRRARFAAANANVNADANAAANANANAEAQAAPEAQARANRYPEIQRVLDLRAFYLAEMKTENLRRRAQNQYRRDVWNAWQSRKEKERREENDCIREINAIRKKRWERQKLGKDFRARKGSASG